MLRLCFSVGPASCLAASLAEENILVGGVVLHAPYITVHKIVQGEEKKKKPIILHISFSF